MTLPPPLRNDCFALPPGVDWTPVDEALALLKKRLSRRVEAETVPLARAAGRVLAQSVSAPRAHPPWRNSAVDGYGFAGGLDTTDPRTLPLVPGRAAAGVPFVGDVPEGHAVQILTGAMVPPGVDTVVLQEDVSRGDGNIVLRGPLKRGANTRAAGEDVIEGQAILEAGTRIGPAHMALLATCGVADVSVFRPLRVAVLSTGDEVREPGAALEPGQITDANRPMLSALLAQWGYRVVNLGIAADTETSVRDALDRAAAEADVVLTSGGASSGDEDHMARALNASGSMALWRVAVKPGRPLALGVWKGCPVFGLPGNPVAAFVCTLIFARPALEQMAGAGWSAPLSFMVPAAFSKNKKPGRREYLRARMRDGAAEVFASEGSGRVTGLTWSEGVVELPDHAAQIAPGTPVKFIPYSSFGIVA